MGFYRICQNCGRKYCGWGKSLICLNCGGILKDVSKEVFDHNEEIEEIEDDIADLKLQNKVDEYKEKYPEHFKI